VLKYDFSTTFSCKKPNDFEGRFPKTWFFQRPVNRYAALFGHSNPEIK